MPFHPLSQISWNGGGTAWTRTLCSVSFQVGSTRRLSPRFQPGPSPTLAKTLIVFREYLRKETVTSPRRLTLPHLCQENSRELSKYDIVQATLGYSQNNHDSKPNVAYIPGHLSAERCQEIESSKVKTIQPPSPPHKRLELTALGIHLGPRVLIQPITKK